MRGRAAGHVVAIIACVQSLAATPPASSRLFLLLRLLAIPAVAAHQLGAAYRGSRIVDEAGVELRVVLDIEQGHVAISALVHHVQYIVVYFPPFLPITGQKQCHAVRVADTV
eukprot:COSAG05_NODE_3403_length_2084_cov_1.359013_1_plen_111_part_10